VTDRCSLPQRLFAEALGAGLLTMAVVGSGIMAERLAGGNVALALLCNALATGAALVWIVAIMAPVSGAHLNPVVTMLAATDRSLPRPDAVAYVAAQIAGAVAGAVAAHLMFGEPALQTGVAVRGGAGQWLGEVVATAGLVTVIMRGSRAGPAAHPALIGLYIASAYWFTSSTSFANPAVTLARALTASFAGIAPESAPAFIGAQIVGAWVGWLVAGALEPRAA
jgi:glycerol uptake facilitator-like aquaporin